MRAVNRVGASTPSNADTATPTATTTVPGAPTGLSARADGQTAIALSWTAPSGPVTGYKIEISTDGGSTWSDRVANTGNRNTTYRHTGLAPSTTRHYRVSAINRAGTGPVSNVDEATTASASAVLPGAPTGPTATASSKTRIALSWTAPTNTGGPGTAITGYRIEYFAPDFLFFSGADAWEVLHANTGSTAITYTHDHVLAPAIRLQYRVSAINAVGTGDPSTTVAEATTQAAPDTAGNGAPDRTGITVNHRRIVITFDENLNPTSVPVPTQFPVTISGVSSFPRPENVDVTGTTVVLTLSAEHAVDADDVVRVRYSPPQEEIGDAEVPITTNALQDLEGNLARKWNPELATNNTPPGVKLVLTPDSIAENGGVSTVTATMVPSTAPAPAALTVTVTAEAMSPAVAADFDLSGTTLTIASGETTSTGTVTITAMNNDVRAAAKLVRVLGEVTGSSEVLSTASSVTLTIPDDDAPPPPPPPPPPTTPGNRAPAFTSADAVSVPEHTTVVLTVQASDPDSEDPVTYALVGGADRAQFTLDGTTGVLAFATPPDFERPTDADGNNIYLVTVQATSGAGARALTADQSLTVTVTDAAEAPDNRAPAFTSPATARVREHTTAVLTVQASDPDSEDPVTYALVGGADRAQFTLDASTGELIFRTPPDYERPTDADGNNIYLVTVQATSGTGARALTTDQPLTVTVLDVFETRQAITPTAPIGLVSNPANVAGWQLDLPAGTPVATRITIGPASPGAGPRVSVRGGRRQPERRGNRHRALHAGDDRVPRGAGGVTGGGRGGGSAARAAPPGGRGRGLE